MSVERFVAYKMFALERKSFTGYILRFAIAAIALSVAVMIITTSVISGFKSQISDKMFDFWGHIVINDARATQEYELLPIREVQSLSEDLMSIDQVSNFLKPSIASADGYEEVSSQGGIKKIYPFSVLPSLITTKQDQFDGLLLKAITDEFNKDIISKYLIAGNALDISDNQKLKGMIISDQISKRMKLSVGDPFILHFIKGETTIKKRFEVSGIYKSGLEEFDKRFAFIDHRWVSDIIGWESDQYSHLEVHIHNLDDLDIIDDYIKIESLPGYLYSESIKSRSSEIFQWLEYQNINEWLTLILMTVVGIFNMITAFLIFTLERTRMIGLLKAMGAHDWSIRKIFLYSTGSVLMRGTLYGVLLGVTVCLLQQYLGIIKLSEKDYYLSQVPIDINPLAITVIAVGSALITLFFLIFPSSIVSRIKPARALQFR